jgi:hypothetical protein
MLHDRKLDKTNEILHKILNISRCINKHLLAVYTFNRTMTRNGLKVVIRRHIARRGMVGGGSGCNAPLTNLDAPTKNLHNTKDKHC